VRHVRESGIADSERQYKTGELLVWLFLENPTHEDATGRSVREIHIKDSEG
jgi:hypothetical protein